MCTDACHRVAFASKGPNGKEAMSGAFVGHAQVGFRDDKTHSVSSPWCESIDIRRACCEVVYPHLFPPLGRRMRHLSVYWLPWGVK